MKSSLADCALAGRKLPFAVIDAHGHWGRWQNYDTMLADDFLAEMDRLGIEIAILSSLLALVGEVRRGNDDLADLLARHPKRFIGYAHVNPNEPAAMVPELERCLDRPGFGGIKIYQTGVPYDDRAFEPVFALAAARKVPILAHTWGAKVTGLEKIAARHPTVPVLMAHSGSDLAYKGYVKLAKETPNLYLDLTFSRNFAGIIEYFVEQVGAERVIWGSDVPLFSAAHQMGKVLFARISDADKELILRGNAVRLFGLG